MEKPVKKIIAIGLLLATGASSAGLVDSVATANWPTKNNVKKYKIEMYGYDARAYEFTTDNGMACVAVYSGGGQGGFQMQCIPTK